MQFLYPFLIVLFLFILSLNAILMIYKDIEKRILAISLSVVIGLIIFFVLFYWDIFSNWHKIIIPPWE